MHHRVRTERDGREDGSRMDSVPHAKCMNNRISSRGNNIHSVLCFEINYIVEKTQYT